MIIKKVILENIKSYVYEEINLYQGINCILGLNGSGKSTIIESIGVALFNYSKGNLNQLLRYDEKKGRIVVNFIANDDREYIVERTIRNKGGSVKIIDAATDTELYSGVSDVYSFIKKILKVSKTKDFTQLFSEIIAVPQGQFVSAFLERPTIRKENFDRLFNLHIYKDLG
ncbi:MAG TPA: SMC family ATPase, partial [Bacilli bacterium]